MADKKLVDFILEARKRGFDEDEIKGPLVNKGWDAEEVEDALASAKKMSGSKIQVTLFLEPELLRKIEKRAKKNMFSVPDQIEDILRRSMLNLTKTIKEEKLDDKFVGLFSRKRRLGKKKKR